MSTPEPIVPVTAPTPPVAEGGPASIEEAQKAVGVVDVGELARRLDEQESVLVALIAHLLVGARPKGATIKHIMEWFEEYQSKYYG